MACWVSSRARRSSWSGMARSMSWARSCARRRRGSLMAAWSSLNFLAIGLLLLGQCHEVLVVEPIRDRHVPLVPAIVSRLVSPAQEQGDAPWIERVQDAVRSAGVLHPQFSHVTAAGGLDTRTVGVRQLWPAALQQLDVRGDRFLLVGGEGVQRVDELVSDLDLPQHRNIPCKVYAVKGIARSGAVPAVGWWAKVNSDSTLRCRYQLRRRALWGIFRAPSDARRLDGWRLQSEPFGGRRGGCSRCC